MPRGLHFAEQASLVGAWFGGALIILAAFVIGFDVALRKLVNLSLGGADELSGYALAIGTTWSLGFALVHRAHIRIDSLYVRFPAVLRAVLDVAGLAGFVAIFGLVAWYGWDLAASSAAMRAQSLSRLSTPLAVPQFLWLAGLALFLAVSTTLLLNAVLALLTGDLAAVQRIAGSRSVREELADELPAGQLPNGSQPETRP